MITRNVTFASILVNGFERLSNLNYCGAGDLAKRELGLKTPTSHFPEKKGVSEHD